MDKRFKLERYVFRRLPLFFTLLFAIFGQVSPLRAQSAEFEFLPIENVAVNYENAPNDASTEAFVSLVKGVLGDDYSPIRVREALQKLFETKRIVNARVEAEKVTQNNRDAVRLRFVVRRQVVADRVFVDVDEPTSGNTVSRDEIVARLRIIAPNEAITEQALGKSADEIQNYLRERGFFQAEVPLPKPVEESGAARAAVTFKVKPNAQAKIDNFTVKINGFDDVGIKKDYKLAPGNFYSRAALSKDLLQIRNGITKEDYLAPVIDEPKIVYDAETNRVSVTITGNIGAKVAIKVSEIDKSGNPTPIKYGKETQKKLFPIRREATLEQSAIEEGRRRLRNKLQEDGYFFADVEVVCSANPPLTEFALPNETKAVCETLSSVNLEKRNVTIDYRAKLDRRLKLVDIRLLGTNQLTIEDVLPILQTQKANALGFVPQLGYGRGYTSLELLDQDRLTIRALLRELGFRQAQVSIRQGVSPDGENLIITFVVRENVPTIVSEVEFKGNSAFSNSRLLQEMPLLVGRNYSRARAANATSKLQEFYAQKGYFEARVNYDLVELPSASNEPQKVKLIYQVEKEGTENYVGQILIVGNKNTKRESIIDTTLLREGELLRSDYLTQSEQNLYATDAFRQLEISTQPAGDAPDGDKQRDVIINVEENPSKILSYGGGYSTEGKATGFFDIRHVNLLGKLYQGGARIQLSQRQQLAQIDFVNPRFMRDGKNRYAPLSLVGQYTSDSQVTRFFRSTIDKGTAGIVQRLDANGNPIDEFGRKTGVPSINRLSVTLETNKTLDRKTRSILFLRFRYEDVRLRNIESLLIRDLLTPDKVVRVAGFGSTYARDTRENCSQRLTLLNQIRTGEDGIACRYSSTEPTRGDYLTADFQLSARQLGGNISFYKFQANYQRFFRLKDFGVYKSLFGETVLAGRANLGVAGIFSPRDRDGNGVIDEVDKTLPISERFFSGGSTSLRGFNFEEAGPRRVIVPTGQFRDRTGKSVTVFPFTVPFGGNALATVNLEARVPLTTAVQIVPFYDGGNVFRRFKDLVNPRTVAPGDIYNTNLRTLWSNTLGLGFRINTPIGGKFAVDYGYLLNPPEFVIPQPTLPNGIYRLRQGQIHFRFTQAF